MLCAACNEHFNAGGDEKWSQSYLDLKTQAYQRLKAYPEACALPELQDFEQDLQRFRKALESRSDSQLPCPWYMGDLSWVPSELADIEIKEVVWKEARHIRDVAASASVGCELCLILCDITREFKDLGDPADLELESWLHLHPISLEPTRLCFLAQGTLMKHDYIYLYVDVRNSKTSTEEAQLEFLTPSGACSSDSSSFGFLLRSFENCTTLHSSCRQERNNRWIPTRLIDVGPPFSESTSVRVVDREELEKEKHHNRLEYLTLSHMWGNQEFLTLTLANLDSLKRGIPILSLKQSFQDAIAVTRRLHIQYLWIDSLCILQDSLDGWEAEASVMGMVYSNGLCNLAACNAADRKPGFFCQRNPVTGGPLAMTWSWSDCTIEPSVFYDWINTLDDHTPLNTRGWVFQERLLSPRTMHFLKFPFWECREMTVCEAYPSGSYKEKYEWLPGSDKVHDSQYGSDEDMNSLWNSIIYQYSRCSLTEPGDKLIALCGIAKSLAALLGGEYLAGIWRQNLLEGLLWQVSKSVDGDDCDTVRTEQYIAPSWSWASVEGPIDIFCAQISHQLFEIMLAFTTPATQDQIWQASGR